MADTHENTSPQKPNWSWPVAGIRVYLLSFALALLIPLFAFAGLLAMRFADAERRVLEAQRTDVTNDLNHLIDLELESIASLLRGLAASPDLAAGRFAGFQAHTERTARLANLHGIVLSDQLGRPVAPVSAPAAVVGIDGAALEAVLAGNVAVSNSRLDLTPPAGFLVTIPVVIDGLTRHTLTAVVAADRLQPVFASIKLREDWVAAVLDRRGTVLARSRAKERFVGQPARAEAMAVAQGSASEGIFNNATLDGINSTTAFRRSRHGWTSMVAVPTAILNAPRNRNVVMLGLTGLLLSTLGIALSYLLGSRIANDARELQSAALEVVGGRRPALSGQSIVELKQVTAAFDYAADMAREHSLADERLRQSEERQRLAIDAGAFGTWDLDVRSGEVLWSDTAFRMHGYEPNPSGLGSRQMWLERLLPEDRVATLAHVEHAKTSGQRYESEQRIVRADTGAIAWLRKTGQFHYDETGSAVRFVGVIRDVTDRKAIEAGLLASEARYRSALKVGRIGSWEANFNTGLRRWSAEGQALFGLQLKDGIGNIGGDTDEFRAAIHPEDRHLVVLFHQLVQTQDVFDAEYRVVHPDGKVIWVAGRGQVVSREADGKARLLVSVVADITERKSAEQHATFLMQEIAHRSKNLLAVIQAIAARTARSATSIQDFETRFQDRLQGLARSNDMLVAQDWQRASLGELARKQLAPFIEDAAGRFDINGPDVTVDATAVQAIGLALHELATNAVKYGALSTPNGRVTFTWNVVSVETGSEIVIDWLETDGPTVVPPTTKGFGHMVIERMVAQAVGGAVTLGYAATGLHWSLKWRPASADDGVMLPHARAQDAGQVLCDAGISSA